MMYQKKAQTKPNVINEPDLYVDNRINIQFLCKQLAYETTLNHQLLISIIKKCKHIISNQPNLLELEQPVVVVGDIHGQFYDLLKILTHVDILRGEPKFALKLVFLGDYVDRGINSMEVMITLMCLKIEFPENIYLLRGNHQSKIMTEQYNFKQQCCSKYSQQIYTQILQIFNLMPIACTVNKSYFCVHGGISDKMLSISKINSINRKQEIPVSNSAFCDFIWSDPADNNKRLFNKVEYNQSRDCSIVYGEELVKQFLTLNNLKTIIRGHQVYIEGYKMHKWNPQDVSPPVITIFSAPNYCGTCGNKSAILKIENNNFMIKQFKQQHPQKYKFLVKFDAITWTYPEMMGNVGQILVGMANSIINLYVPELKDLQTQKKVKLLVKYTLEKCHLQPIKQSKPIKVKQFLNAEEQRNYLFNRSHEYFAQYQKLPKHQPQ